MARFALAFFVLDFVSAQYPGPTPPPPPLSGNILYHLFERKYTGLVNKDAGDFKGDMSFIFSTFSSFNKENPEASLENNIIEMSQVNVTGWNSTQYGYEACNAPGCNTMFKCPANSSVYCCSIMNFSHHGFNKSGPPPPPAVHYKTSLPGAKYASSHHHHNSSNTSNSINTTGGWWFSFPLESEGTTWTEKRLRRIEGKCLGNAWRKDAGGCQSCGQSLDQCVAQCIQSNSSLEILQKTWDRVFSDPTECPEVPLPGAEVMIV